ncbi:MAG TPA: flagellar export chaperone FliS [Jatrophihabitans sp.]|jgi:flagellar protein FliS|uniref:flagellar export chaperone FliS n=1 Tax=Jatrophihabitans sp. TaxID=1932789 RepID=UPI002E027971|nr:flagellar export chaperone FliS [Jatrophihabitans sp.]
MAADELRARFLRDRVMTASPAQRVVMIYDRLNLDLARAAAAVDDPAEAGAQLAHAMQIVTELHSSLDTAAGGPADNLSSIYAFLIRELIAIRGGQTQRLPAVIEMVTGLREAWATAAEQVVREPASLGAAAGAWVG